MIRVLGTTILLFALALVLGDILPIALAHAQSAAPPAPGPTIPLGLWIAMLVPAGWVALTSFVNTVFRFATPADVDAWAERNPKIAWVAALFRRGGVEPVAVLGLLAHFFAKNPPPPSFLSGNVAMGKRLIFTATTAAPADPAPPPPSPTPPNAGFIERGVAFGLAAGALCAACGLLVAAPPALTLAQCEVGVAKAHPGESFVDFVNDSIAQCGQDASITLVALLTAIVEAKDAELAPYQPPAKEALADGAKLNDLRTALAARRHP